MNLMDVG